MSSDSPTSRPSRAGRDLVALVALALLLFSSGAVVGKVRVVHQEGFDLSGIRTYDFFIHESRTEEGPYAGLFPKLRALIIESLANKGFERDTKNPDFLVTYDGQISDSLNILGGVRTGVTENGVWEIAGPGPGIPASTSQGLLVIRMHESREEDPFWGGAEVIGIAGRLDAERIWKKASKAAKRILAKFPAR